jgi:hypothetical protein
MDVVDGESVAAADIVGVVVKVVVVVVMAGAETDSCKEMAEGDGGWGLGGGLELGPKAWLRLEEGETG